MPKIEKFIAQVEAEAATALTSGVPLPKPLEEKLVLKRLAEKYPELGIDPVREGKIIIYAGILLNAHNN